jgi:hypothetical protein
VIPFNQNQNPCGCINLRSHLAILPVGFILIFFPIPRS